MRRFLTLLIAFALGACAAMTPPPINYGPSPIWLNPNQEPWIA